MITKADWDTDDALESVLAEWFPHGIATAETRGVATTEDLLSAALAVLRQASPKVTNLSR